MGVFTFVCKSSGDEWNAKQIKGELEASATSTFELQRKLVQTALSTDSSSGIQSSFSLITPSSIVSQVIIGGGGGGVEAFFTGGAAATAPSRGAAPVAETPATEEKKEEKVEKSDEDMGFPLFD